MFGAKKEKLLARYWMKELVPPKTRKGEYWFEARPKYREDAANYKSIRIILDEKQFLPLFMEIFPPKYDGRKDWSRESYAFTKRKVNDPIQRSQQWMGRFISPKVPFGWQKVVTNFGQPAARQPAMKAQSQPNPRQAQRNAAPSRK